MLLSQNPANKQEILCDEQLRELTGVDKFTGFAFAGLTKQHFV